MKKIVALSTMLLTSIYCISQKKYPEIINDTAVTNLISRKHVLLTNSASFKGYTDGIEGASGFLINYNSSVYAVTAKHLLGEGMGIEPEIKPGDLQKKLIEWKMFPRVPVKHQFDTVEIKPEKLNYDLLNQDILILEIGTEKNNSFPLTPNFILPQKGDRLYLVGCPYSQEKCLQNIYKVIFDNYNAETATLTCTIQTKVELSGFSGAPIIDSSGKVVAVLTTGWEDGKTKYIGGTFIKEIEKVK